MSDLSAAHKTLYGHLDRVEHQVVDLARRITELEAKQRDYASDERLRAKDAAHLDARFDRIEKRLDKGDSNISRLIWIVGAAVLSALVGFILKGGLIVPMA